MAEAVMNQLALGKFKAYSAGSQPRGEVHPFALNVLQQLNYDTSTLRSKSWDEFTRLGAPQFDFVFTVCDIIARQARPNWPDQPATVLGTARPLGGRRHGTRTPLCLR
jgi:protein-tyrosine-phosphatase